MVVALPRRSTLGGVRAYWTPPACRTSRSTSSACGAGQGAASARAGRVFRAAVAGAWAPPGGLARCPAPAITRRSARAGG
eukprot:8402043-Alexandrium_andersonii.AAC.1